MIKKIIVRICLFFTFISFAQEGTSSPYSFYGIGDIKYKGTVENRAMGGLTIFRDSIHLNIQNPASYSFLRYTSFSVGGNTNTTRLSTSSEENKTKRTTFDYISVGLPFKNFGVSFGVIPYSSVGYRVSNRDEVNLASKNYIGSGGINKVFLGAGYKLSSSFSVGLNVDYNFGKIKTTNTLFVDDVQYGTQEINTSNIRGGSVTAGLSYLSKFKGKIQISSGLTYTPKSTLVLQNARNIATLQYAVTGNNATIDNTDVDSPNTSITMPSKISFGVGFGEQKKWQVGAEIISQKTSDFGNRFNDITNIGYENSTKFMIGGFYTPKYNSFTNYLARVTYRTGFNYQNTGLVINGRSIKDQCFTFGIGLPVTGTLSNVNIGFEFGKRGTQNSGLIQENYSNIFIGLSFNDRWFVKRKYD